MSLRALFALFFRAGMSFGAGTGISALLLRELVEKRQALSRGEFMAIYGLGRVVPSGTVTALAVAFGYRYQRWLGTVAVLVAMILPSFTLTILLTVAYTALAGSFAIEVINATLMPAALGVVLVSGIKLGREFFSPSVELVLAAAAFAALLAGLSPTLLLLIGGAIGAVAIRERAVADGGAGREVGKVRPAAEGETKGQGPVEG